MLLVYSLTSLEFERANGRADGTLQPTSFDDLRGFGVDVFRNFLDKCPLDYRLMEAPHFEIGKWNESLIPKHDGLKLY